MVRILCVLVLLFGMSASAPACDVVIGGQAFGGGFVANGFGGQAFAVNQFGQPVFVQQAFSPFAFQQQAFVSPFAFQQRAFISPFGVRRAVAFDAFGNPFVVRRQRGLFLGFGF